jgi:hypothetical protein
MEVRFQHDPELNFEKVWAMFQETDRKFQETDRQFKETDRKFQEAREESDRQDQKARLELKEIRRETQKILDDLGRKLGVVDTYMFIPNLHTQFHRFGFTFGKSSTNLFIQDRIHQIHTEVDVLLENGDCAMAVEIKTQPNSNDIRDHVERMEKLRQWADLHNDNRKLYGAIAGAIFPDNVLNYALKRGFYVIEQSGDTLNVTAPDTSDIHAW